MTDKKVGRLLLRVLCWICVIWGGSKLAGGIGINLLYLFFRAESAVSASRGYSIGIIGGADGPTSVFVAVPVWTSYLIAAAVLAVGIFGLRYLRKKEK